MELIIIIIHNNRMPGSATIIGRTPGVSYAVRVSQPVTNQSSPTITPTTAQVILANISLVFYPYTGGK